MTNPRTILALCVLAIAFLCNMACRGTDDSKAPVALQDTIPVVAPMSTFRIPISYAFSELQAYLNEKISGKFLETTIYPSKNDKDQVKVELRKSKNIIIASTGSKLEVVFPLKVEATILNSRINFVTKGMKPIETEVVLLLRTPVALDAGWNLVTHFELDSIIWVKAPVMTIAGIKVDLTNKIEEALKGNKEMTALLDDAINKAVSLDKPVGKIWEDLQRPIIIHKNPPYAYLKFITEGIGGDFMLGKNNLVCFTTIKARVAIVSESAIKVPFVKLPPFKSLSQSSEYSDVDLYAFAEFDAINTELSQELEGRSFTEKGLTASIEKVKVFASDSGLATELLVSGDIDGTLVATGVPAFDSVTQRFSLNNFQFNLSSSQTLVNAGVAILNDRIRDTIQSHLTLRLDSLITKIPNIIEEAIAKGKTGKAIDVEVNEMRIHSCNIKMDAKRIHLMVHTTFKGTMQLKHFNAGKSIMIRPKEKQKQE